MGDKRLNESRQKIGGGRMGDNNILNFSPAVLDKKCHFPLYFHIHLHIHFIKETRYMPF